MQDYIEMPSVVTPFKVGGFTLYVYAYRRLSPREGAEMFVSTSCRRNCESSQNQALANL